MPFPFIWGAYNIDTGEYVEFTDTKEFIKWACERKRIVYAHNGGKFDWHFIIGEIPLYTRVKVINGRLAKFKIGLCEFRDSWNILPQALAAYKKDEINYAWFERDVRHLHMEAIRKYLRADCEYLADLIREFIDQHGTKLTLAGAAMSFAEKQRGEKADKSDEKFYKKFAPFYAGGRVQVFHQGEIGREFNVYDIRSAYPRAMMDQHPSGMVLTVWDGLPETDEEIQRAFIQLECESHGAFFYRSEDGSLDFPADGERRLFHVTGWEYLAARDTGTLVAEEIRAVYELAGTIHFRDYVNYWFAEKSANKKGTAKYTIAKLFLNSLYGKFAADPRKYRDYQTFPSVDIFHAQTENWRLESLEGETALMSVPTPDSQKRFYNVATAASITGAVRAKLWRAICAVSTPLYCDTDSIACVQGDALDLGERLGQWDHEATCDNGWIAGKKLYAFHETNGKWKIAAKGVKISPEEIKKVALGGEVTWESEAPTFRVTGNTLYQGEMIGYVKRDDPQKMFQRRTVRMRTKTKGTAK